MQATFPWPPAPHGPIVAAFAETWRRSLFQPREFFRAMPPDGTGAALLYYLPLGVVAWALRLFWRSVFAAAGPAPDAAGWPLVEFLLSPVLLLLLLAAAAVAVHATLKLVGGARARLGTTARVLCFAYGPQLLGAVPAAGAVAGTIWMVVLATVGVREAHGTTTARAAAAVLAPLLLLGVVLAGLAALAAALGLLAAGLTG